MKEEPKRVPVQTLVNNDKSQLIESFPHKILREKLKKDFFGENCTLTLDQMIVQIQRYESLMKTKAENKLAQSHQLPIPIKINPNQEKMIVKENLDA